MSPKYSRADAAAVPRDALDVASGTALDAFATQAGMYRGGRSDEELREALMRVRAIGGAWPSAPSTAVQVEMRRRTEDAWARESDAAMTRWSARPNPRSEYAAITAGIATLGLDLVDPRGVLRRLPVGNASVFRRGQLVVLDGETFAVTDVGAGSLRVVSCSEAGRNARASWERSVVDSLDAQRIRDLAARDEIRAWMRRDRTRDGERVLPLP